MVSENMPLGIVLERREIDNRWEPVSWRAVAVIPGAPETDDRRVLAEGPGWVRYHAATLPLEIHRKDTEGYKYNLGNDPPMVYLILRFDDEDGEGVGDDPIPFAATVCPYEAQAYLDGDEDLVEPVPMPDAVRVWLGAFVETHHVDEPFYKRKRTPHDPRKPGARPNGAGGANGEWSS